MLATVFSWVVMVYPWILALALMISIWMVYESIREGGPNIYLGIFFMCPFVGLLFIYFNSDMWIPAVLVSVLALILLNVMFKKAVKRLNEEIERKKAAFFVEHSESKMLPKYPEIVFVRHDRSLPSIIHMRVADPFWNLPYGYDFEAKGFPTKLKVVQNRGEKGTEHRWKYSEYTPPSNEFVTRVHQLVIQFDGDITLCIKFPYETGKECGWIKLGYLAEEEPIQMGYF